MMDRLRQKLRGETGSLKARSTTAALWSFGGIGLQRGLSLMSNLIMTRFLIPEDFGLMAIVMSVLILVEMMSDIGIRQSIVRSERGEDLTYLRVAWTVQILRSLVIAALVLLIAAGLWVFGPALEGGVSVYADPQLPGLIAVAAFGVVLAGLESVGFHVETRALRQKRVVIIEVGTQIITLALMILLVQLHPTVWVLLWGLLIARMIRVVWTHVAFRAFPMWPTWDREIATELWLFGRWLIGSSLAGFIVNNGDRFLLGALLPKETFGFYVIAMLWLQAGVSTLSKAYDRVIYPALSEVLRSNRSHFATVFGKVRLLQDIALSVSFVAIFLGGPILVGLLYPAQYAMTGTFLSLLSFRFLATRPNLLSMVLLAEQQSKSLMISNVITACIMCAVIPFLFWGFDINAAVMGVAISPIVSVLILVPAVRQHHPRLLGRSDYIWMVALVGVGLGWSFLTS